MKCQYEFRGWHCPNPPTVLIQNQYCGMRLEWLICDDHREDMRWGTNPEVFPLPLTVGGDLAALGEVAR